MLPCLFSCFASCMMSGELFYGWCVLGAAVAGHGSAGASPAGQEAAGEGRGGTLGLFQPQRFHDFMALRCPSRDRALLPAGRPPSPQRDSGHVLGRFWGASGHVLGRFWAHSGQLLARFWARSGPVLGRVRPPSLLPVPCPALSPSEELWRLRHRSHSVLFGESTPPAQDYPADSHIDVIYAAFQLFLRQMGRSHPSPCEI